MCSMTIHTHVEQLKALALYLFCENNGQPGVIWGHSSKIFDFGNKNVVNCQCNIINSTIHVTHSHMCIRVHQLKTFDICHIVLGHPGPVSDLELGNVHALVHAQRESYMHNINVTCTKCYMHNFPVLHAPNLHTTQYTLQCTQ